MLFFVSYEPSTFNLFLCMFLCGFFVVVICNYSNEFYLWPWDLLTRWNSRIYKSKKNFDHIFVSFLQWLGIKE